MLCCESPGDAARRGINSVSSSPAASRSQDAAGPRLQASPRMTLQVRSASCGRSGTGTPVRLISTVTGQTISNSANETATSPRTTLSMSPSPRRHLSAESPGSQPVVVRTASPVQAAASPRSPLTGTLSPNATSTLSYRAVAQGTSPFQGTLSPRHISTSSCQRVINGAASPVQRALSPHTRSAVSSQAVAAQAASALQGTLSSRPVSPGSSQAGIASSSPVHGAVSPRALSAASSRGVMACAAASPLLGNVSPRLHSAVSSVAGPGSAADLSPRSAGDISLARRVVPRSPSSHAPQQLDASMLPPAMASSALQPTTMARVLPQGLLLPPEILHSAPLQLGWTGIGSPATYQAQNGDSSSLKAHLIGMAGRRKPAMSKYLMAMATTALHWLTRAALTTWALRTKLSIQGRYSSSLRDIRATTMEWKSCMMCKLVIAMTDTALHWLGRAVLTAWAAQTDLSTENQLGADGQIRLDHLAPCHGIDTEHSKSSGCWVPRHSSIVGQPSTVVQARSALLADRLVTAWRQRRESLEAVMCVSAAFHSWQRAVLRAALAHALTAQSVPSVQSQISKQERDLEARRRELAALEKSLQEREAQVLEAETETFGVARAPLLDALVRARETALLYRCIHAWERTARDCSRQVELEGRLHAAAFEAKGIILGLQAVAPCSDTLWRLAGKPMPSDTLRGMATLATCVAHWRTLTMVRRLSELYGGALDGEPPPDLSPV